MRELFFIALVALTALSCFTAPSRAVHWPDASADAQLVPDSVADPGSLETGPGLDVPVSDDGILSDGATGPDAPTNDGLGPSDGGVTRDADAANSAETTDAPDAPGVPPGTLRHVGWFGPGGVVTGTGPTGLGSLSGPRQGWLVQ